MRRALVAALVLGVVAGAAAVAWNLTRDDDSWVVRGRTADYQTADRQCADLPGVQRRSFSSTSDMPVGSLSEGVHWVVEGREQAAAVASCLKSNGVPEVVVERERKRDLRDFEKTGP